MDKVKSKMIVALEKYKGIVTDAARSVGMSRQTHYNWLKEDPEYKAAVDEIDNVALDFAESKLHEKMTGVLVSGGTDMEGEPIVYSTPPSDTALIFYLKTKGKKRGYIERQEITGPEDGPINIVVSKLI